MYLLYIFYYKLFNIIIKINKIFKTFFEKSKIDILKMSKIEFQKKVLRKICKKRLLMQYRKNTKKIIFILLLKENIIYFEKDLGVFSVT